MLYWICAAAAMLGVWINIRKHPACYWIWLCTNAVWTYSCFDHGMHAQACLHIAYMGLSVYGIRQWGRGLWSWRGIKLRPARPTAPPRLAEPWDN